MYQELGVDANKDSVRKAFMGIVQNDFPGAFVNIIRDRNRPGMVFTMHSDGDGSKFLQRLLYALVTGDFCVLRGAVDDAFSMNTGDVAAAGFIYDLVLNDVININGLNLPKDKILLQIAQRIGELLALYRKFGFDVTFTGGETADLPNQTPNAIFDVSVYSTAREVDIISGNVRPGDCIFGFRSDGRAIWETEENSGMMSNGVTLARICLMLAKYNLEFPFLVGGGHEFRGRFCVDDVPTGLGMSVSQAIMAPTRQWAFVIRSLITKLKEAGCLEALHGISMNTGGGAGKIGHVGKGILYVKDMPEPPPLFQLIKEESGESWEGMFSATNGGYGLDVVCQDDSEVRRIMDEVSKETLVNYRQLGVCEKSPSEVNSVILHTPYGIFTK